jgi:hypothetical protein
MPAGLYPEHIWSLFKSHTRYVPPEISYDTSGKKYQLFEVVFTKLVSLINTSAKWKVTPIQGDNGIDFFGEQHIFELKEMELSASIKIGGQCKRRGFPEDPVKSLSGDIVYMLNELNPVYVIIGFAGEVSELNAERTVKIFTERFQRPFYLFSIKEIDFLIRRFFTQIKPIIVDGLSAPDAKQLIDHFETSQPTKTTFELKYSVDKRETCLTGDPFRVVVQVESSLFLSQKMKFWWRRPGYDDKHNIILIRPAGADSDSGIDIIPHEGLRACIELKFVSYVIGSQDLGEIVVFSEEEIMTTIPLGIVKQEDDYKPRFYWGAFESERIVFTDLINKVFAGSVKTMAINGEGGSGKSRLCFELGTFAEQNGAEFFAIAHVKNYERPYKILGDLLLALIPDYNQEVESPYLFVKKRLGYLNQELAQNVSSTLSLLFDYVSEDQEKVFEMERFIQCLIVLSLNTLREKKLVIHFSDLHWCHSSILTIISEYITRLKKFSSSYQTKILFLFEGRYHEKSIALSKSAYEYDTVTFEEFVDRFCDENILIKPLSQENSLHFLENLFENRQSNFSRVSTELIPHQSRLIQEILKYGAGNPFHMIEQIKLLINKNIVIKNERTGLLFLINQIDRNYEVPKKVEDLIAARFEFISANKKSIANLLFCLTLISDEINYDLFCKLKAGLAPEMSMQAIRDFEIVRIPFSKSGIIKFRHENYYSVIRNLDFSPSIVDKGAGIYYEWYDNLKNQTADVLFHKSLILLQTSRLQSDVEKIYELLEDSYNLAQKNFQEQLCQRIIAHVLQVSEMIHYESDEDAIINKMKWKQKLANILLHTGNWIDASRLLEESLTLVNKIDLSDSRNKEDLEYAAYLNITQLANSYINQLKTHKSIGILEEHMDYISGKLLLMKAESPQSERWWELVITANNRLGVAYWHDGNYSLALEVLKEALQTARSYRRLKHELNIYEPVTLMDSGAVKLHFNPSEALTEMDAAIDILKQINVSPRYGILAETTRLMGQFFRDTLANKLSGKAIIYIKKLETLYLGARKHNYNQEQSAAGLVIGIIYAYLKSPKSRTYFMEVINTCYNHNLLETLWKAHLNLAQSEMERKDGDIEAAALHARYAEETILRDLLNRSSDERRFRLTNHLRIPIVQIMRIYKKCNIELSEQLMKFHKISGIRPDEVTKGFENRILSIDNGISNYFLYGG